MDVEKYLCVPACCQQARRKSHAPPPPIPCVCVCVCMCLIVHVYVHVCMCACVHVCLCACACVCARMKPAYRTYTCMDSRAHYRMRKTKQPTNQRIPKPSNVRDPLAFCCMCEHVCVCLRACIPLPDPSHRVWG